MRPAPFEMLRPQTKQEALNAMADGAVPLAGGQSLLQGMRLGTRTPKILVDLSSVSELDDTISETDGRICVGARVTHRQFAENSLIRNKLSWLAEAAAKIGDVQVRNLGTVLGNVCWADPRANMAVSLMASNASVIAATGEAPNILAKIPLSDFFTGYQQNSLGNRLACSIEIPLQASARGLYREFSRQPQDLALCNVCVLRDADQWRIALGGIAQRPERLFEIEDTLSAMSTSEIKKYLVGNTSFNPPVDAFGDREFKMQLAATLIHRAVTELRAP